MHTVRSRFQKSFFTFFGVGIFVILAASFAGIFGAHPVFAQTVAAPIDTTQLSAVGTAGGLGSASLGIIISRIIRIFFGLLGAIALGLTLYAGFKWMLAKGDPKAVDEAKAILKNGVIGLVIIFSAFSISDFLVTRLFALSGVPGFGFTTNAGDTSGTYLGLFDGSSGIGQVVEWHDPIRDAADVSRNTVIQVKFKFPIDPASLINTTSEIALKDKNGAILSGPLKKGSVLIYATKDGRDKALSESDVWVTLVQDGTETTYVFDPIPYLGSASENIPYTVEITNVINKLKPQNVSAFSGLSSQGYKWNFTVGTNLDLTPPRIVSVVPVVSSTDQPRNITLQLTFSEPINLASAVGIYDPIHNLSFDNITARGSNNAIIPGTWRAGDGFNVIEFTALQECATNACGEKIFCLPASDSHIELRALSGNLIADATGAIANAQIDVKKGYVGVTDAANNALDGGGENGATPWSTTNGQPKGTPTDDYFMHFGTSGVIKVSAPQIISVEPAFYANAATTPAVTVNSPVSATFDSLMKVTTFDAVDFRAKNVKARAGFWKTLSKVTATINGTAQDVTKLTINHVPLAKDSPYAPIIPSTVLDNYQNCFLPAAGVGCHADITQGTYSCCNGVESTEACTSLQQYGTAP